MEGQPLAPVLPHAQGLAMSTPHPIPIQTHLQETKEDKLVEAKQHHLQQGHEQQLNRPSLASMAPKEISTAAAEKSALIMLGGSDGEGEGGWKQGQSRVGRGWGGGQ